MEIQPREVDPLTKKVLESESVSPIAKKVAIHMKALGVESYDEATLGMLVEFVYRYVVETGEAAGEVAEMSGRKDINIEDVKAALRSQYVPRPREEQMKHYASKRNSMPLGTFPLSSDANNFTCQTTANGCSTMNSSEPTKRSTVTMMKN